MSTKLLQSLINFHNRGIRKRASKTVLQRGGCKGFIGVRGYLAGLKFYFFPTIKGSLFKIGIWTCINT